MKKFKTLVFLLAITIGLAGTFAFTSKVKGKSLSTPYHYTSLSTDDEDLRNIANWEEGVSVESCEPTGTLPCTINFDGPGTFESYLNGLQSGEEVMSAAQDKWTPAP